MERTRAGANPACLNKLERNEVGHVRRQNGVKRPLERLGWNERPQRMELEWREEKWRKLVERRVIGGGKLNRRRGNGEKEWPLLVKPH